MTNPTRAQIRKFLSEYFNDDELTNLCFDYFRPVENEFTIGMLKSHKIRQLVGYCENHGKTENLLAAIEGERPILFKEKLQRESPTSKVRLGKKKRHDPKQIFLSHSHQDAALANKLSHALRQNGWQTWMAPDSIQPGEKWVEAINRGMEESGVFLLIMTQAALDSSWVLNEANVAIALQNKGVAQFIPLEVEPVDTPILWSAYQRIDFSAFNEPNLGKLLEALENYAKRGLVEVETEKRIQGQATEQRQVATKSTIANISDPLSTSAALPKQVQQSVIVLPAWVWGIGVFSISVFLLVLGYFSGWFQPTIAPELTDVTKSTPVDLTSGTPVDVAISTLVVTEAIEEKKEEVPATAIVLKTEPELVDTPTPTLILPITFNGHEWKRIPAGAFIMGANDNDVNAAENERPQEKISSKGFWISKYETTNAQYKNFVEDGNMNHLPARDGDCNIWSSDGSYNESLANHPVVCVSWHDAIAYAEWLSAESGTTISLPSEANWEKAARGEYGQLYPWGDDFDGTSLSFCDANCTLDRANIDFNDGYERTAPVGRFPSGASLYGVEDMAGNVWEWTSSIYEEYPYDSTDGREDFDAGDEALRTLRGGSWRGDHVRVRTTFRVGNNPSNRFYYIGFRVMSLNG